MLAPGLVNLHTHLEYAGFGGFGDGLAFGPWLDVHIERKSRQSEGDALALARLGVLEAMRGGATTVVDASFTGASVAAASELGLRAVIALEVFGGSEDDEVAIADRLDARLGSRCGAGGSARRARRLAPRAVHRCTGPLRGSGRARAIRRPPRRDAHRRVAARARRAGARRGPARRPFAACMGRAVWPPSDRRARRARSARARDRDRARRVRRSRRDRAARRERGRRRPLSALERAARMRNRARWPSCGRRVCRSVSEPTGRRRRSIWTPSPSYAQPSSCSARRRQTRVRWKQADALRLATLGGAEALGLEHSIGSLAPGKRADLVAVRLGDTAFWPCEDPVADLVLAASGERVIFTMVNGIVRYRVSDDSYRAALARGRDVRRRMLALST